MPAGGGLQRGQVELLHAEHGLHRSLRPPWSGSFSSSTMPIGHDLPGQAVLVLEPAARALLAALGELVPVVVDLVLVGAVDQQRDRLVEGELRAAVDGGELLAVEHEVDGQHRAGLARAGLAVVGDVRDLRVREHRDVELGGLLALGVEPEVGGDPGHGALLRRVWTCPLTADRAGSHRSSLRNFLVLSSACARVLTDPLRIGCQPERFVTLVGGRVDHRSLEQIKLLLEHQAPFRRSNGEKVMRRVLQAAGVI